MHRADFNPHKPGSLKTSDVSDLLHVELHPVLQLLRDVLVFPLSQVGHNDSGVEGARVGSHAQLLDSLLLEVKETYVVVLLGVKKKKKKKKAVNEKLETGFARWNRRDEDKPPGFQLHGRIPWPTLNRSRLRRQLRVLV